VNDGPQNRSGTDRWWLDPALARAAFGTGTRPPSSPAAGTITVAMQEALHRGEPLDLKDPEQRAFGEYELLELIGRGGMGCIYRARQHTLDREVAIKLLSAGQWANEELIETLRREAHQTAALRHPNIVVVHELGEQCGLIFYVMEFVPGRSLAHRIDAEGPLPPAQAATLVRSVAEAVDYAHRLGVLHLDLKPANILIDDRDEPRIADFGLARRIEQALEHDEVTGTPSYMAPEQVRTDGPPLSPATDIWALGAVLYEAMTGRPPFASDDPVTTLRMVSEDPLRPPSRLAAVPADLEAVCLRCLTKEPARRYAHARALADDLGHFIEGRPVSVRPLAPPQRMTSWARRQPRTAISVGLTYLALLAAVLLAAVQWQRADRQATVAQARVQLLERSGLAVPAAAPAGTPASSARQAAEADPASSAGIPDTHPGGESAPAPPAAAAAMTAEPVAMALSPDGASLAMLHADGTLRWYDPATLLERQRMTLPDALPAGLPSTGAVLGFTDAGAVRYGWEWPAANAGAGIVPPASSTVAAGQAPPPLPHQAVVYSADGRHAVLRGPGGRLQLWAVAPWRPLSASASWGAGNTRERSQGDQDARGATR
jgi:tRNA A-37 threonylcarbamoyl transferase component Bud32